MCICLGCCFFFDSTRHVDGGWGWGGEGVDGTGQKQAGRLLPWPHRTLVGGFSYNYQKQNSDVSITKTRKRRKFCIQIFSLFNVQGTGRLDRSGWSRADLFFGRKKNVWKNLPPLSVKLIGSQFNPLYSIVKPLRLMRFNRFDTQNMLARVVAHHWRGLNV